MKPNIKFIYFDLGGVIINNNEAFERLSEDFSVPLERIVHVVDTNWRSACRGDVQLDAYMAELINIGIRPGSKDFVDFVTDYQGIYQQSLDLVHELKKDFKLGILSNAELGMIETHMQKGKLPREPWSIVIESAQYRTVKPEQRIYEIAESLSCMKAEEIFFIDDREEMVAAAVRRGWSGHVFDTHSIPGSIAQIKKFLSLT